MRYARMQQTCIPDLAPVYGGTRGRTMSSQHQAYAWRALQEAGVKTIIETQPCHQWLYADIVENGIYLTGGGALLHGLAKRLSDKMTIEFHVADDPLHSVAKGTGIALQNINNFSFLMNGN